MDTLVYCGQEIPVMLNLDQIVFVTTSKKINNIARCDDPTEFPASGINYR